MPLYMDIHIVEAEKLYAEDVVKAHMKDLSVQKKYGVIQRKYWVDTDNKRVFCLMEGPSKDACHAVHEEAHGMTACNIVEVSEDEFNLMLTGKSKNDMAFTDSGELDSGFRTLLWVGFEDFNRNYSHYSSELNQIISNHKGYLIPQPGTLTFGLFNSPVNAVICAVTISQLLKMIEDKVEYKISIITGQPLEKESQDLFSNSKTKLTWVKYLGASNHIYLDLRTKNLVMNNPDAPNISFNTMNILDGKDFSFLEKLFTILNEKLSNPKFGIEQLNKALGMSKATSYRAISSLTGMSPNRLIQEFKMQMALDLLKNNNHSISEIADTVGYNSSSYFTHAFKNRYGILPTSYWK